MSELKRIDVEVWSDILVFWSWAAKQNLEAAIREVSHKYDVCVRWMPFFVDVNMPEKGYAMFYYPDDPRLVDLIPYLSKHSLDSYIHNMSNIAKIDNFDINDAGILNDVSLKSLQ